MDVRSLTAAQDLVAAELRGTEQEFEQLKVKRARLESILTNLTALLKDSFAPSVHPEVEVKAGDIVQINSRGEVLPVDERPSWMIIRDVFPKGGGSLTVPEIHKLVNAKEAIIPNPDAIRIAMRRHPETFINTGGRYTLTNTQKGSFALSNAKEATEVAS